LKSICIWNTSKKFVFKYIYKWKYLYLNAFTNDSICIWPKEKYLYLNTFQCIWPHSCRHIIIFALMLIEVPGKAVSYHLCSSIYLYMSLWINSIVVYMTFVWVTQCTTVLLMLMTSVCIIKHLLDYKLWLIYMPVNGDLMLPLKTVNLWVLATGLIVLSLKPFSI